MKNSPAFASLKKQLGFSVLQVIIELTANTVALYSIYNIFTKLGRTDILFAAAFVWLAMLVYSLQVAFQNVKNKTPDPNSIQEKLKQAKKDLAGDPMALQAEKKRLLEEAELNKEQKIQDVVDKAQEKLPKSTIQVTLKILNAGLWLAVYLHM